MIWTLLGTGTSTGVPLILCKCPVCRSKNPKNKRLRASVWVQVNGKSILIDTSTDLRQQALRAKIPRIDAVLYTHPHADHIHGIDELRGFNFFQKDRIPLYGNAWTCRELNEKFHYIFSNLQPEGGGIPLLDLHQIDAQKTSLSVSGIPVIPLSLEHGSQESVGYRIGPVAYVTDCSAIPLSTQNRLQNLSVLILDCVRLKAHRTHFNLEQALEAVSILRPKKTYLTHLGHDFEYKGWTKRLPKGVAFAYDGLVIKAHQVIKRGKL